MRLFFPLSGDDVFISYSRRDGALYAAGLADTLTKKNLSCFIDKLGTEPNHDLPPSLRKKIKNCTVFVLIGTEKATQSEFVGREITEFKETGRTILPIDFDNNVGNACWYEQIPGLAVETEKDIHSLETGNPSENVVNFVEKSFNYTRRNQYMFRMFWGALSLFLVLLGLGVGAFIFAQNQLAAANTAKQEAEAQTAKAVEAKKLADEKEVEAIQKTKEAKEANEAAENAKKRAKEAGDLAEEKTRLADEKTKIADAATKRAEEQTLKADAATKKADEQTQRAEKAQQQVEKGRSTIAQNYYSIAQTSYQTEPLTAFPWSQKAVETTAATDENQELYKLWTLNLTKDIPQIIFNSPEGISGNPVFDPKNNYAATITEAGKLTLWNLKTGERQTTPLDAEDCDCPAVSLRLGNDFEFKKNYNPIFSPDGKFIAVITGNAGMRSSEIRVWEIETGVETPIEGSNRSVYDKPSNFRFSPDSRFVYLDDALPDDNIKINVWSVSSGKEVSQFQSQLVSRVDFELTASKNPERNWILTFEGVGYPKTAVVRNIATGEQVGEKISLKDTLEYINFTGNAGKIVMIFRQKTSSNAASANESDKNVWMITAWDIEKKTYIEPTKFSESAKQKIIGFSKDDNRLIVEDTSLGIDIWDLKEKRVVQSFGDSFAVTRKYLRANFTDDEKRLVTIVEMPGFVYSRDKQDIKIYNAETEQPDYSSTDSGIVNISSDGETRYQQIGGRFLAYRNKKNNPASVFTKLSAFTQSKQLSLDDGECIFKMARVPNQNLVLSLSFSNCTDGSVKMRLWDLETGSPKWNKTILLGIKEKNSAFDFNFGDVFFDESGKSFVTMIPESAKPAPGEREQKDLRMWETESGTEIQSFIPQKGYFKAVSLSVARNRIITVRKNEAANLQGELRKLDGSLQTESYLGEFPPQTDGEFFGLTRSGDEAIFFPAEYANNFKFQPLNNSAPGKLFNFSNPNSQLFAAKCLIKADKLVWDDKSHIRAIFDEGFSFVIADWGKIELISSTGAAAEVNAFEIVPLATSPVFDLQFAWKGKLTIRMREKLIGVYESKTGFPYAESTVTATNSTFVYSEIRSNQNTMLVVKANGEINFWNLGLTIKQQPFWAKEMGEALSGMRVINDTQTQMLRQEEYLEIRRRYLETLKQKAASQGDAEAQLILDNWNP